MMMNFLDLSAASEEERRLISELLSDTSVVNFPEPTRQQVQEYNYDTQTQKNALKDQPDNALSQQPNQQHYRSHNQPNHQLVKSKAAQTHYQRYQQSSQLQQNHTITVTNNINQNHRLNHVQNHNASVTSDNHQPNHMQMPSQMAGDINPSVLNMDITNTQHGGYPMPTSAHVPQAYAPPPHMYGGPPIFQPYPIIVPYHNLVYGNMSPYSVLPATNSVVTPRQQQVPAQSNEPQSTNININTHNRPHSHTTRQIKTKENLNKQSLINHSHSANNIHPHPLAYSKTTSNIDSNNISVEPEVVTSNGVDYKPSDIGQEDNGKANSFVNNGLKTNDITNDSLIPSDKAINTQSSEKDIKIVNKEDDVVKVSSDEGFETSQTSSLDVSKQSQESSNVPSYDISPSSLDHDRCNNKINGQHNHETAERLANVGTDNEKDAKPSSWSSAASKSWASLFKADGTVLPTIHGDSEHNNVDSINSDEDNGRNVLKRSSNLDTDRLQESRGVSSKTQRTQDASRRALDKMAPRLAQKINSITLKHSLPLLRPRGFINKGNGCYINSTLQALIACPPFYNLMKEIGDLKDLRREYSCTPILDKFAELFLNFPPLDASKKNKQTTSPDQKMQISQLQAEALEPKCIYDVLGQIKSECLKGAQEDAEEFLSSVLNGLHEEMIGLSETLQSIHNNSSSSQNGHQSEIDDINGDSTNEDNLWREVGPKNRSLPIRTATVVNTPIQEIFGGSLFSIRTAGKDRCGHRSPFFTLQLDISGDNVKSLQDAIKSFTATEIIHDFYCSKTKQKLDAHRRTSLDQLPPIMILHLKQFIYSQDHGLKKITKRIEYPIDFELPDSCLHEKNADRSLRNSRTYKLLAVVYHEGKEAVKGHYLTDVYHIGSSQWIRCDDSNLKVVPAPRIDNPDSTRTPYLLFYRRLNTLKPPQSNSNYNHHDNNKKKS